MPYKALLLLALAILLTGCANTYSLVRQPKEGVPRVSIIDTFCIAVNGSSAAHDKTYTAVGLVLSDIIRSSLEEKGILPETESSYLSLYDALKSARAKDCDYIIYATIASWEDHSAVWDGVPNKAEIRISIIDAATGNSIDSAILGGKSRRPFAGDLPQDLVAPPVENYLSGLFREGITETR